jgi:glycosyltransferase involved in cell wall biosynthesis
MKVCLISRGDLNLFPPTQGASNKLFHTLYNLSLLGVKAFFVAAEHENYFEVKNGKFIKKNYPCWLAKSPLTDRIKKLLSFLGIPPDIYPIYHPLVNFKFWLKVLYVTFKEKINVLQPEFTAFGLPAIFVKLLTLRPICLVEHNVETFQIPEVTNISKKGMRTVRTIEKFVCKFSDKIVAITQEDKKRLEKLGIKKKKIVVIPHGVDINLFKKTKGKKIKRKYKLKFPTLIFHGVYSYKPNYEAIKILTEKILPKLEEKGIKAKLLAVGDYPPNIRNPNIIFTGVVKNLPDYIDATDIAVVPIKAGGGMRMKILEYFAAKKPVISTKRGIEGIPIKNGKEAIITNIENFPQEIVRLIKSKELKKKLAENAYKFVQKYDWKHVCEKYVKIYGTLLKNAGS